MIPEESWCIMFEKLIDFKNSKEWIMFESYYNRPSFLNQVNFFRFEDLHTNFIASLLDENNIYGLGNYPLRLLLELVAYKNDNILNKLELLNNYLISDVKVETQKVLKAGRLDMFIQFKFNGNPYLILFEDKLFSSEGLDQCLKYSKEINGDKQYEKTKKIFIYLSLEDNQSISDNEYIKITYDDLVDKILIPCSLKDDSKNLTLTIGEYIKGFESLYEIDNISYKNIPLTIEGRNLTLKVWEQHNDLIEELLNEKDKNEYFTSFYKEHKTTLRILLINLLKLNTLIKMNDKLEVKIQSEVSNTKKRNVFDGKSYYNYELIFEVLRDIVNNHENITAKDLNTLSSSSWKVIIPESEMENEPRKGSYSLYKNKSSQETISIKGERYYYCISNTGSETEAFKEAVINKYPEYRERIKRI